MRSDIPHFNSTKVQFGGAGMSLYNEIILDFNSTKVQFGEG